MRHDMQQNAYGVGTISRLLKTISLFGEYRSLLQGSFTIETYNFKEPTNRSHPISLSWKTAAHTQAIGRSLLQKSLLCLIHMRHDEQQNEYVSPEKQPHTLGQFEGLFCKRALCLIPMRHGVRHSYVSSHTMTSCHTSSNVWHDVRIRHVTHCNESWHTCRTSRSISTTPCREYISTCAPWLIFTRDMTRLDVWHD